MRNLALAATLITLAACVPPGTAMASPAAPAQGGSPGGSSPSQVAMTAWSGGGFSLSIPEGWTATPTQTKGGVMIVVQEDPGRRDAAALVVMAGAPTAGATEDSLLDTVSGSIANLTVTSRDALAGGRGHFLIGDGVSAGAPIRFGGIAVIGSGAAAVGGLFAPPAEFDRLGGVQLVTAVLGTMQSTQPAAAPATAAPVTTGRAPSFDDTIEQMKRQEKRTDRGELDPDRPALARTAIVGAWGRGTGSSHEVVDSSSATTVWHHADSQGTGEVYRFNKDGSYVIVTHESVSQRFCTSKGVKTEKGTYKFDGKQLVMKVTDARGVWSICDARPETEVQKKWFNRTRTMEVGLADDGHLILVGPACGAYEDMTCPDHARWEMPPVQ